MEVAEWDSHKNPLCDRCQVLEETFHHIFCCHSKDAADTHKKVIAKLRKALQLCLTAPIITNAISQLINDIRRGYSIETLDKTFVSKELREITRITAQTTTNIRKIIHTSRVPSESMDNNTKSSR